MTGSEIRMSRLLQKGRNAVVVAVDHGEFFGPLPGLEDLPSAVGRLSEADGILMAPGMVSHCRATFFGKKAPALVVRMNWASSYAFQWNYNESHHAPVVPPDEVLALGADFGLASCVLKTGSEGVDADNIRVFAEIMRAKRHAGLPVVGEYYPVHRERLDEKQLHEQVAVACRVMAELGADAVKTFYTGKRFREIVAAVPIPVLVLGADKTATELAALELAGAAVQDGARGVFFGRNVVQSSDPARFLKALKRVVTKGAAASDAARDAGFV